MTDKLNELEAEWEREKERFAQAEELKEKVASLEAKCNELYSMLLDLDARIDSGSRKVEERYNTLSRRIRDRD